MKTSISRKKKQLKESIEKMLLNSIYEFNAIKFLEEFSLIFLNEFKECRVETVDENDIDRNWSEETYRNLFEKVEKKDISCRIVEHNFKLVPYRDCTKIWETDFE